MNIINRPNCNQCKTQACYTNKCDWSKQMTQPKFKIGDILGSIHVGNSQKYKIIDIVKAGTLVKGNWRSGHSEYQVSEDAYIVKGEKDNYTYNIRICYEDNYNLIATQQTQPKFKVGDIINSSERGVREVVAVIKGTTKHEDYWDGRNNPKREVLVTDGYVLRRPNDTLSYLSFDDQDIYQLALTKEEVTKSKSNTIKEIRNELDPVRVFFGKPRDYITNSEGLIVNPISGKAERFL